MKLIVKTALLLITLSVFSTQAKFVECFSCQSDTSFLNIAKAKSDLIEGISYIYVANSNTEQIRKFMVRYENGGLGEPVIFRVNAVTIDSATYNTFSEAMVYRNSIENFFATYMLVPDSVALSAWQLAGNSVFQRDIALYYSSHQSLRESIANYTATLFTLGGKLIAANLVVSIKFGDNSTANYKIVGLDANGDLEFEFMNATDNLGNPIPANASGLSGQFRMTSETLSNYSSAVTSFHFSFSQPLTIPAGSITITDCVTDVQTKEVTCTTRDKP